MSRDPADLYRETCATDLPRSEQTTIPDLGHGDQRPTYWAVVRQNEQLRKRIADLEVSRGVAVVGVLVLETPVSKSDRLQLVKAIARGDALRARVAELEGELVKVRSEHG